jgi:hypothetical protein
LGGGLRDAKSARENVVGGPKFRMWVTCTITCSLGLRVEGGSGGVSDIDPLGARWTLQPPGKKCNEMWIGDQIFRARRVPILTMTIVV